MTIKVDAGLLHVAHQVVSKDLFRYYISGVLIQPHPVGGAMIVATDGARMIVAHDPDGEADADVIVHLPSYFLAQCKRGRSLGVDRKQIEVDAKAKTATLRLQTFDRDGAVNSDEPLVTAHKVVIDGTFPDWRKVTPKQANEPVGFLAFNVTMLAGLAKLADSLRANTDKVAMYMMREGKVDGEPIVVRWDGVPNIFAVLMPLRTDHQQKSLPDFMAEPVPQIAAE